MDNLVIGPLYGSKREFCTRFRWSSGCLEPDGTDETDTDTFRQQYVTSGKLPLGRAALPAEIVERIEVARIDLDRALPVRDRRRLAGVGRRDVADACRARRPRPAVGGVCAGLLVAHVDELDAVLAEGRELVVEGGAGLEDFHADQLREASVLLLLRPMVIDLLCASGMREDDARAELPEV